MSGLSFSDYRGCILCPKCQNEILSWSSYFGKYMCSCGWEGIGDVKNDPSLTELYSDTIVQKTDPRLKLRGKLDTIQAMLLNLDLGASASNGTIRAGIDALIADISQLQVYEAMNGKVVPDVVERLNRLHNAVVPFCTPHTRLSKQLNVLRTQIREAELVAWGVGTVIGDTIAKVLNRMAQVIAISMEYIDIMLMAEKSGYTHE